LRPPAALVEKLARARFRIQRAEPSLRAGERRSRAKGAGLEFVDHRPYQPGDDIKHLDSRLLARLDETYVRQYSVDRQLPVAIVIDGSRSMHYGTPDKFDFACRIGQLLAFVALAGGDRVRFGLFAGDRLRWSPQFHGGNQTATMFDWLGDAAPGGSTPFTAALKAMRPDLTPATLLVLISDFWVEDLDPELRALTHDGHEIVAVHVIAPEERDPAGLGDGPHFMIDAESGGQLEITLDGATFERYRTAFGERLAALAAAFKRAQGRYLSVGSDSDPDRFILRELRNAGVVG